MARRKKPEPEPTSENEKPELDSVAETGSAVVRPDDAAADEPAADTAESETADAAEPGAASSSDAERTADAAAEPVPVAAMSATAPRRRSGGLAGGLIGGVLAAAIGFGAAQYLGNDRWPFAPRASVTETMQQQIAGQAAEIASLKEANAALSARLEAADAAAAEVEKIRQNLQELWTEEQGLIARVDELATRLVDVENRPIPDVGATQQAVATYERELAAMRQMLADELARIEAAQQAALDTRTTALASAETAVSRALVAQLQAAIDTGSDSRAALAALDDAGVAVPDELRAAVAAGVPTVAELQAAFPEAARAALDRAVRDEAAAGQIGPVAAFLRSQLGIRSLEPRAGDDPDAVLSRAEALLKKGDVEGALSELASLPDAAQAEIADWRNRAERRVAAVAAARALSATVNE